MRSRGAQTWGSSDTHTEEQRHTHGGAEGHTHGAAKRHRNTNTPKIYVRQRDSFLRELRLSMQLYCISAVN